MLCALVFTGVIEAQPDSLLAIYKKYMGSCNADSIYSQLKQKKIKDKRVLGIGSFLMYHGKDECGDELMRIAMQHLDTLKASHWHQYSVQNTKNGNYANAYEALTKVEQMDAKNNQGYIGWVLLYYYRDYRRALKSLIAYDNYTPDVPDFPVGENIDFLKGLCYYNLGRLDSAYLSFHRDIDWHIKNRGKEAVNGFSFFYAGRCLDKMGKIKQALKEYKSSIQLNNFAVEGYYYTGLLYSQTKPSKAKACLEKALVFSKKGYKQQDVYVELFDEVYQSQIREALDHLPKN